MGIHKNVNVAACEACGLRQELDAGETLVGWTWVNLVWLQCLDNSIKTLGSNLVCPSCKTRITMAVRRALSDCECEIPVKASEIPQVKTPIEFTE